MLTYEDCVNTTQRQISNRIRMVGFNYFSDCKNIDESFHTLLDANFYNKTSMTFSSFVSNMNLAIRVPFILVSGDSSYSFAKTLVDFFIAKMFNYEKRCYEIDYSNNPGKTIDYVSFLRDSQDFNIGTELRHGCSSSGVLVVKNFRHVNLTSDMMINVDSVLDQRLNSNRLRTIFIMDKIACSEIRDNKTNSSSVRVIRDYLIGIKNNPIGNKCVLLKTK